MGNLPPMTPALRNPMKSPELPESSSPEMVAHGGAIASAQSRCSPVLTPLAYALGRHLVVPGYFGPITITGQHHLPAAGPVILAPTHRARWDSILLPFASGRHVTGRDLRFMVTADEVRGVQGWFIRRLGGFAVNVRRPTVASLRYGIDLLLAGEMLVIYPEGGIRRNDRIHPLKPGLARLAVQAQAANPAQAVQVIPVDIAYGEAFPRWRCPVKLQIGSPLSVHDYLDSPASAETLKAVAQQLTQDLQTRLKAMVAERQGTIASTS
jgi:1-acyl-sn-glycerol-3-phosphate acyltransferase